MTKEYLSNAFTAQMLDELVTNVRLINTYLGQNPDVQIEILPDGTIGIKCRD